ncbi:HOG (high osmolarity glycerol) pathway protein [Mortierella claussenii]|nr:HOG (high osmolarity glycerol) pathway protein [Mortierella claussenii]
MSDDFVVVVRDFAYPVSHPYHAGNYPPEPTYDDSELDDENEEAYHLYEDEEETRSSWTGSQPGASPKLPQQDLDDRTYGHAQGLYDFDAENATELTFKEGEYLWIHCRRFPGWFLGELNGVQGLVPENYVQMV